MKKVLFIVNAVFLPLLLSGQDINYAKEIVQTLASPEFKGRGYVENGNELAAEYIRSQFQNIGLLSFEEDYDQEFTVNVNTFPKRMMLKIGEVELMPGKDFLVDPFSAPVKGKYEVIILNKERMADEQAVVSAIQSAAGKFLIIDERTYEPEDKEEEQNLDEIINFLKYSPQSPVSGVVIVTSKKLTWGTGTLQSEKSSFMVNHEIDLSKVNEIEVAVDARMMDNYKTQNLIGFVRGKIQPDSFLVATAHYDHLGKMGLETYFPGANDNSSGIAMLLSLATHYSLNPHDYSFVFIATGAEELGLLGASYFTEHPLFDLERIKFLVNFDLAGTGEEGIRIVNGSIHKKEFDIITRLNNEHDLLPKVDIRGAACNSDHCMFHEKGVLCFFIYTQGGIKAYHDIYDKYETLPLTEFVDYMKLMTLFFDEIIR